MGRLLLLLLPLVLGSVTPSPTSRTPSNEGPLGTADALMLDPLFTFTEDEASLNDMFREVEELMEDTQSKLQNAVKEMKAEEILSQKVKGPDPVYHNKSDEKIGNQTIQTDREMVKETDNKTGSDSATFSETKITSFKNEDKRKHECIVDEDCGNGSYCYFANSEYKCLHCKSRETCTRDGECCEGQLCVLGQCTRSAKGQSGTICESQEDCIPGLCCAVQSNLLFPVCTPLPLKGEPCYDPTSQMIEIINWDLEPARVLDRCPCSPGLMCHTQSNTLDSLCEEPTEAERKRSNWEIPTDVRPFIGLMPQGELSYEDGDIIPTPYGLEVIPSEETYNAELETVPEIPFEADN